MTGGLSGLEPLGRDLEALIGDLARADVVSAASALVGDTTGMRAVAGFGGTRSGEEASIDLRFDLASLSKSFTATLALVLDAEGSFPLATLLGDVWPSLDARLARASGEDLLRHRAGLRPWAPLYAVAATREQAVDLLLSGEFIGGAEPTYSDLGFLLWSATVERALGKPLGDLLRSVVLDPLDLADDITTSASGAPGSLAECDLVPRRERSMARSLGISAVLDAPAAGEVQDGNARWWGGYSGHAGLFGSSRGVWKLAREWLEPRKLPADAVRRALRSAGGFRLGWWTPEGRASAGPDLGPASFGHTGFTGGSVWADPDRDRVFVLLAHRCEDTVDLDPWRRRLHALS